MCLHLTAGEQNVRRKLCSTAASMFMIGGNVWKKIGRGKNGNVPKFVKLQLFIRRRKNKVCICQGQGWKTGMGIEVSGEIGIELISSTLLSWGGVAGWPRQQVFTRPLLPS